MPKEQTHYAIRFTEPAIQSIEDQTDYLAYSGNNAIGDEAANRKIQMVLDQILIRLTHSPYMYPVAPELVDLAILDHRRLLTGPYRVFYDVQETAQEVVILMLIHEHQSVEQALIRYCLMAPLS